MSWLFILSPNSVIFVDEKVLQHNCLHMKHTLLVCFTILGMILVGCSDDSNPTTPEPAPTTYDSTSWRTNSAAEFGIKTTFNALVAKMKTGRTGANLTTVELTDLYSPMRSIVTLTYDSVVAQSITGLADASGGTYNPLRTPEANGQGGVYGGFLFDEYGIENEQIVEKGLFAAGLYNYMYLLSQGSVTPATIDRMVTIYGAHPSFPNTGSASVNPDVYVANYGARRDKNDGNGLYTQMKTYLIAAQTAAKTNNTTNLNAALLGVRQTWERIEMATVINYCYAIVTTLSKTTVTDAERASAMHAYSECIGFITGFSGLPAGSTIITEAQINELRAMLKYPATGLPTSYELWQQPSETLPQVVAATVRIQSIYGFTDTQMEDFKKNWVSEQGRK